MSSPQRRGAGLLISIHLYRVAAPSARLRPLASGTLALHSSARKATSAVPLNVKQSAASTGRQFRIWESFMKLRSIAAAFGIAFSSLFFASGADAQGVIVPMICDIRPCRPRPIPRPQPLPNALPVKSIQLDTKINGQVATTHVEQVFRNDTPYTLEGTYFFPIPETASIVSFAIWENGKKLVGEVRSREEARRIYDEIVRRQRDPGLLEYAGKDLFQASIFPIPPH